MKLVRLPHDKDDTVTLAPLFDFRLKEPELEYDKVLLQQNRPSKSCIVTVTGV